MIKTVIFDLGGVYFTDGTKRAIGVISKQYGVPQQKVKEVLKGDLGTKLRIGAITPEEFWTQAKSYWETDAPSEELSKIWFEGYTPIEGTVNIIDRLNSAGYEVIFLSDNVQERVDYLEERYHFLHRFKEGVFSHLVHTRKPDSAIYQLALEKASNPADQCIYVDDKPEVLQPARDLGMQVVAFEGPSQLEVKLKEAGLNF